MASLAALAAGYQLENPGDEATFFEDLAEGPAGGGAYPVAPVVEIFYSEAWHDITSFVFYGTAVTVTRGRPDEASTMNPSRCTLVLNNRLGYFSPRNPTSPLYGLIGRNTPIRVSRVVNGSRFFRFHGEVVAWPQTWDLTGRDIRVPIEAAGVKRRLGQGNKPLNSVLFRAMKTLATVLPLDYWPCEDGSASQTFASVVTGGSPITWTGTPSPAADSTVTSSDPLPTVANSTWKAQVQSYVDTGVFEAHFVFSIPAGGTTNNAVMARVFTTGTVARWDIVYTTAAAGSVEHFGYDAGGALIVDPGAATGGVNGTYGRIKLHVEQSGSSVYNYMELAQVLTAFPTAATEGSNTNTHASSTSGKITSILIDPNANMDAVAIGHVAAYTTSTGDAPFGFNDAIKTALPSYRSEKAGTRARRLCTEQGVNFRLVGAVADTQAMGPQGSDKFTDLVQATVDSDLALQFEPVDGLALGFRTRKSLYNQTARLTLDYSAHELSDSLKPVDDDQLSKNLITVSRDGGSSATAEQLVGPLSTADPPTGIGVYDDAKTLSLYQDSQLVDQAGWRLRLGALDEPRYPEVDIQLSHPSFTGDYTLTAAALTTDVGDRIDVSNPPAPSAPDTITMLVQGYTEVFDQFLHAIVFTCTPYTPWNVWVLEDPVFSRADTDWESAASVLATDYPDPTTTSLQVSVVSGPLWTTAAGDFPLDVMIAGERVTVTNITGASSPQTFTVTRSVNGVVKAQAAGAVVSLADKSYVAL